FVELQRRFEPYMPTKGNIALEWGPPGLVLWDGMSEEFASLINGLLEDGRLHLHGTTRLVYFIDGGTLNLPAAKRYRAEGYKRRRWLPACLRVVPNEAPAKGRRGGRRPTCAL